MTDEALSIAEVYKSIQGETSRAGRPCSFVRVAGCNLRCSWCDTAYARDGQGESMTVTALCRRAATLGARLVCITGGEPLLQPQGVAALAARLLDAGHDVLVETNGTIDLSCLPEGVARIVDVKCPGSGECGKTLPGNLGRLGPQDEVKFVIADRADFDWAVAFAQEHGLTDRCEVLLAPACGRLDGSTLAQWMLKAGIEARLQLQLHKLLWPGKTRGV